MALGSSAFDYQDGNSRDDDFDSASTAGLEIIILSNGRVAVLKGRQLWEVVGHVLDSGFEHAQALIDEYYEAKLEEWDAREEYSGWPPEFELDPWGSRSTNSSEMDDEMDEGWDEDEGWYEDEETDEETVEPQDLLDHLVWLEGDALRAAEREAMHRAWHGGNLANHGPKWGDEW